MKVKTADLTGAALDWAVAKCEGYRDANDPAEHEGEDETLCVYNWAFMREPRVAARWLVDLQYSTNWAQGGPIIERERIILIPQSNLRGEQLPIWSASVNLYPGPSWAGPTPLVAAMRCFVASKLGDEVDIPEELMA